MNKIHPYIGPALVVCLGLVVAGCTKQEETPTAPSGNTAEGAAKSVTEAVTAGKAAVETAVSDAQKAATEATKKVEVAATAKLAEVQSVLDKAKGLLAEKKYSEALAAMNPLSGLQLTPEQQKLVDDLKAQIQKAMAAAAIPSAPAVPSLPKP